MPKPARLQNVYLARHGETAWSLAGRHTGLTDVPLAAEGERAARQLGARLRLFSFAGVFSSPLQRAMRTCELAGYGASALADTDLAEWDYGDFEGRVRTEILALNPNWRIFHDGCPGGESPAQIAQRADRVIARIRALDGDVLVFSHAHLLRMLAARWVGQAACGDALVLGAASLSVLGYEHALSQPVIRLWNDLRHLDD